MPKHAPLDANGKIPVSLLPSGMSLPSQTGNSGKYLKTDGASASWDIPTASVAWGAISGTLSSQTDLQTALNGKSDTGHNHSGTYEPSITHATGYAKWTGAAWSFVDETYSLSGHTHSGTYQPLATVLTNTTASYTTALDSKLAGIASGATANSSDATLLARANHTGTQAVGTITGLATVATSGSAADLTGNLATARLNGGTGATASTFWCGDGTWKAVGGGSATGVLSDLQVSILQSDGTLNAASGVQTWSGTNKTGQDVFTVEANSTYRVKGKWIVNTGATTHTTAMAFSLSTATVTNFQYLVNLWSAAANTISTAQSSTHVSGVSSKVLNATSTAVYTLIEFEGIMVVGTGGTVTPQVNFSANPTGTNLMKRGSWTSFEKLGSDTVTTVGGWA